MLDQIKEKFNALTKTQKNIAYGAIGFVFFLLLMGMIHISQKKKIVEPIKKSVEPKQIKLDGVTTNFDSQNEMSALSSSQEDIDILKKEVKELVKLQKQQSASSASERKAYDHKIQSLNNQIIGLKSVKSSPEVMKKKTTEHTQLHINMLGSNHQLQSPNMSGNTQALDSSGYPIQNQNINSSRPAMNQISTFNFSFTVNNKQINQFDSKHFAPTGTFAKAVMLNGADASAGTSTQGDASPVVFKILQDGYGPNGERIPLKGCLVTAGVTGDISSERGIVKLDRISCTRPDHKVLDIAVEGTAIDSGGKNGIRGIPVLRNGKIITMSGLSGLLSGIGSAINQASQTTTVSPLGMTSTVSPNDIAKAGAGKGLDTAMSKISQYYIDLANQYHPIIELNAGSMADLVFLGGFSLDPNQTHAIGSHKSMDYNNLHSKKNVQSEANILTKKAFQNFNLNNGGQS
jgi:conjugal transfer pilus assembly protein TraB